MEIEIMDTIMGVGIIARIIIGVEMGIRMIDTIMEIIIIIIIVRVQDRRIQPGSMDSTTTEEIEDEF